MRAQHPAGSIFVYKADGSAVRVLEELRANLHNGCAVSVLEIPFQGTFDHFHPMDELERLAPIAGPGWLVDQDGLVLIRCQCKRVLGAIAMHSIDADGTVRGPVLHSKDDPRPCGWHSQIKLISWMDGEQSRGILKKAPARLAAYFEGRS